MRRLPRVLPIALPRPGDWPCCWKIRRGGADRHCSARRAAGVRSFSSLRREEEWGQGVRGGTEEGEGLCGASGRLWRITLTDERGREGMCAYLLPVRVAPWVLLSPDDAAARVTDETADEPRMRLPLVPGREATAKGRS